MERIQGVPAGMSASGCGSHRLWPLAVAGALGLVAFVAGCGTVIETPLPEFKPVASTTLTQAERAKAVEELNRKRATHEQDAEEQIEQAR